MTLDNDMRRRLARAGRMEREWHSKRDLLIVDAIASGASLREVADAVGIAHSAVDRVVKKAERS